MATKPGVTRRTRLATLLGVVFGLSVVWGGWLLLYPVHADRVGAYGDSWEMTYCGDSPSSVLETGGRNGSEPRADDDAFAADCVAAAHDRNHLAVVAGAIAVASGGLLLLVRRRELAGKPEGVPVIYSFSK